MDIQTDTSDAALIIAIRANLCQFFRTLAGEPDTKNPVRWNSSVAHPWFNGILVSYPPTLADDTLITETIQRFNELKVNAFTWWLDPQLKSSDWAPLLSRHGFGFSKDTPGMAMDLERLNATPNVDGLEIRDVKDDTGLQTWVDVFVPGYGLPLSWKPFVFETWKRLGLNLPMRNYIAYLNGKPVATSCLFLGGGAAGIYSVSTLPEARGKGIGAAITVKPLLEAREMGYRIGTLQASDMGFNIYKKLGFKHLCQIENFYLSI